MMDQLDMREEVGNDQKFKINVFLEDLYNTTKGNKKPLEKAKETVDELCLLIKKVSEKTKELAEIFGKISENYQQLEKNDTSEMESIQPKIGKICVDLKTGFFGYSNILDNKNSQLKKLVSPLFDLLKAGNKKNEEVSFRIYLN